MVEEQFVTFEDLDVIRDNYIIPSSIVLLPPTSHETFRDYCPGHLCLNEYMLRARAMTWFCEHGGYQADRYLWRELLILQLLQGYAVFPARDDVKAIDNPPDSTLGWKSRFFFARLLSERDILSVPERWVDPFPDPISQSMWDCLPLKVPVEGVPSLVRVGTLRYIGEVKKAFSEESVGRSWGPEESSFTRLESGEIELLSDIAGLREELEGLYVCICVVVLAASQR
ncbi:hypothetical protein ACLOJK_004159 [Asimina triloba]